MVRGRPRPHQPPAGKFASTPSTPSSRGTAAGDNDIALIADLVATAVLRRHLETMERLGIEYDFLPRESEILSPPLLGRRPSTLMIEKRRPLPQETEGKNKDCWVMRRAGNSTPPAPGAPSLASETWDQAPGAPLPPDEDAKVIVRSNGTVTYVGKDIAYHLWKFGLLKNPAKDFWLRRPSSRLSRTHTGWISTSDPAEDHPDHPTSSPRPTHIYNVIDSSQSDPQNNVKSPPSAVMGYQAAAARQLRPLQLRESRP